MSEEILDESLWKEHPKYKGYEGHPSGYVRNSTTKRIFNPTVKINKYLRINLAQNIYKSLFIHRFIADIFCKNPDNKPQVNHINGDKHDNRALNLEWCTSLENMTHMHEVLGSNSYKQIKITKNDGTTKIYPSIKAAAKDLNVTSKCIYWTLYQSKGIFTGNIGRKDNLTNKLFIWKAERIVPNNSKKHEQTIECHHKEITLEGFTHLIACSKGFVLNKLSENLVGFISKEYIMVSGILKINSKYKRITTGLHRLIARVFIGEPSNDKMVVNHKDGNKQNNCLDNLEWTTHKENSEHARKTGLCDKGEETRILKSLVAVYQLSLDGVKIKEFNSLIEAVQHCGIKNNNGAISQICKDYKNKTTKGRSKTAYGFKWCYAEDYREPEIKS